MDHHATTATMPEIKPSLFEKIGIIRGREGNLTVDQFAEKIGMAGPTLRAYCNGTRQPSKFARLYLAKLVDTYEAKGWKAMLAATKEAKE